MNSVKYKIFLAVCLFLAGWVLNGWRWESAYQKREIALQQAVDEANTKVRGIENERIQALAEQAKKYETTVATVNKELATSRDVSERLRNQLRAYSTRPSTDSTATSPRQTAETPAGVLVQLFEQADAAAGVYAEFADRSRAAGLACEQAYDTMFGTQLTDSP